MYLRLQRAPTLKRCESVKGSAWCCDLLLLQLRGCLPPCVPQSQTQGDLVQNCMKQTLSSFIISEPLSLTTLYLIHFSQISVLKEKKKP